MTVTAPQPIRVLLMEDDRAVSYQITKELTEMGFEVETTQTAYEAVETFLERPFDAIIADMVIAPEGEPLPDGGVMLIHRMNSLFAHNSGRRRPPIIAISGAVKYPGMKNILDTAKSLGADDAFSKPVNIEELAVSLRELVSGAPKPAV